MLNWPRIEELRNEVGPEAFGEVVDLFLEEVSETLADIGTDPGALEQQLHFLKGASLNLGLQDFTQICTSGEQAARDGRAAEVDIAAIHDSYARCRDAFLARATRAGFLAV